MRGQQDPDGVADQLPGALPTASAEPRPPGARTLSARTLRARTLSARTQKFYAVDWGAFVAWCRGAGAAGAADAAGAAGAAALPAEAATLAAYVAAASARLGPGAIGRRLAAIADQHRRHGFVAPTRAPAVKAALKAVRRTAAPRQNPTPSPARLSRMISGCPGDLAGLRDRALLLLMQQTGLGRAALVSLDAENFRTTAAGLDLLVGDEAASRRFTLSRNPDSRVCAVQALQDWLRVSDTSFGPVFRKIDRWGNVEHHRLGTDAVRRILARRTPASGRRSSGGGEAASEPGDPP